MDSSDVVLWIVVGTALAFDFTNGFHDTANAVAALFANGIDPMVVIRWKDIFTVLERAIDATETAAHILEGIVIKNA